MSSSSHKLCIISMPSPFIVMGKAYKIKDFFVELELVSLDFIRLNMQLNVINPFKWGLITLVMLLEFVRRQYVPNVTNPYKWGLVTLVLLKLV